MKVSLKSLTIACFTACLLFVLPTASADEYNRKTKVTFSAPFEVPGVGAQVLPAGTYVFKLLDSLSNRHIVQIFNADETHLYTTILAIPNYRVQATDKTVITFKERAAGEPEAIRAWFYPGHKWGEEFVYSKPKALALAKASNMPVLYTPVEIASVEELNTVPIEAIAPTGEAVPLAEVVQAPPVEVAKLEELPKTASFMPLIALIGFLSLGAAGFMRKYSA
jgi:LPXTG-motif cell wall-anchored protein